MLQHMRKWNNVLELLNVFTKQRKEITTVSKRIYARACEYLAVISETKTMAFSLALKTMKMNIFLRTVIKKIQLFFSPLGFLFSVL